MEDKANCHQVNASNIPDSVERLLTWEESLFPPFSASSSGGSSLTL